MADDPHKRSNAREQKKIPTRVESAVPDREIFRCPNCRRRSATIGPDGLKHCAYEAQGCSAKLLGGHAMWKHRLRIQGASPQARRGGPIVRDRPK